MFVVCCFFIGFLELVSSYSSNKSVGKSSLPDINQIKKGQDFSSTTNHHNSHLDFALLSQTNSNSSKDKNTMSTLGSYQKPLRIFASICVWYFISAVYNIYNKRALSAFGDMPWTVATIQMGTGIFIIIPMWFLNIRENPVKSFSALKSMFNEYKEAALFQTITHASGVIALGLGAVSFTQIVKAAEPFFTAILSMIFLSKGLSFYAALSLIPIVLGVSLSSMSELTFSWACLTAGVFANIFSAARVIRMKQQQLKQQDQQKGKDQLAATINKSASIAPVKKLSTENFYSILTIISFLMLVPVTLLIEGKQVHRSIDLLLHETVLAASTGGINIAQQKAIDTVRNGYIYALVSGVLFYLYNELSFSVLAEVNPITHAICNTLKRVVIIVSSVLVFGNPLTPLSIAGAVMSMVGVFLYSLTTMQKPAGTTASPAVMNKK